MVRVLITLEPRMYREAIAGALQRARPDSEVMLAPERSLDGQVHEFAPHVFVRSDSDVEIPEGPLGSVVLRVEVLYTDHMGVRVSVAGGRLYIIQDASMDDLISLVDEAEALVAPLPPEEDKRVKTLLRSLSVLDEWLDKNEGRIDDEARVRRIKGWREEALQQLGLWQEGGRP